MTRRADEIRARWTDVKTAYFDGDLTDMHDEVEQACEDIPFLLARNAALERVAQAARNGRDDTHWDMCPCDLCQALAALDAEGEKV